jgi:RecB family endonuclease NucS
MNCPDRIVDFIGVVPLSGYHQTGPGTMRNSIIISVKEGEKSVTHLIPVRLQEAGIREVRDLQMWILEKPEVLGEPLLILDDQFSKFEGARDRPDILCVDREGHIVVVELKRTDTADDADLQSLRYAAMLRSLTIDDAAGILSRSRRMTEKGLSEENAKKEILEFMASEESLWDKASRIRDQRLG